MDPKDKGLLFIDVCAKYPYGLVVKMDDKTLCVDDILFRGNENYFTLKSEDKTYVGVSIDRFKPYLRSVVNMTDTERAEYMATFDNYKTTIGINIPYPTYTTYDWLNKHHFDFRGLIKKGLALEAPDNIYV